MKFEWDEEKNRDNIRKHQLKYFSETNWERLEQMTDEEIDVSDIPPLDEAFFANAELRLPKGKVPVVMSVDTDVLEWFKSQGIPELDQYCFADLRGSAQRNWELSPRSNSLIRVRT